MSDKQRSARIDDIECLRAFAILFVLIAHTPALLPVMPFLLPPFTGWEAGVDLFFVISGFVIARSLLDQIKRNKDASFARIGITFWIRRAFRILPAAWFWLAMSPLAATYFNTSMAFPAPGYVRHDVIAAVLQYANLHLYFCANAMAVCEPGGVPDGIYWSLSLEEQFYLIFPFLAFFLRRRALVSVLVAIVLAQLFIDKSGTIFWFVRSDGLATGVLLALGQRHLARLEPRLLAQGWLGTWLRPVLTMGLLACLMLVFPTSPLYHTAIPVVVPCGILVFLASFNCDYVLPVDFLKPLLLWLGTRSYALYLMHFFAYSGSHEIWYRMAPVLITTTSNPGLYRVPTALVLLVVGAELTHRLIEVPFRDVGRWVSARFSATQRLKPVLAD